MSPEEKNQFLARIKTCRHLIHSNDGFDGFTRWCDSNNFQGLGNASISIWVTKKLMPGDWTKEQAEKKIGTLELAISKYIEFKRDKPVRSYSSSEQQLLNTQWYIYFYYPVPTPEIKAEFGRIVLSINKQGFIELKNINDGSSPNYDSGEFRIISPNLLLIDIANEIKGVHVHMKVYINPSNIPSEVMLGSFLSNGRSYISSGTVVFEYKNIEEDLTPETFSYERKGDGSIEKVRPEIRKFLSPKSLNYLRVPDRVFLFKTLATARNGAPAPPSTRFIELGKPIIFISAPTYSLSDEKYELYSSKMKSLIRSIKQEFNNEIDLHFYAFKDDHYVRLEYLHVLKEIRQTSLFFLIYLEKTASNSLIELGMAYAYAKNIRIYAANGALPRNGFLRNNSEHIVLKEIFKKDLNDIFSEIRKDILATIAHILFK